MDNAKNFAKVTVSTGYDADDTSIVLTTGHGAKLPTAPFNVVWWNATDYGDPSDDPNVEIVRVTAISTDTLTVTRGQEDTSGSTKNTAGKTYKMIAGLTAKVINDDIPALGGKWEFVAEAELGSAAQTLIDATSISTDYDAFRITFYAFSNSNSTAVSIRLNNNSSTLYSIQWLRSSNTTVSGTRNTGQTSWVLDSEFGGTGNNKVLSGTIYIQKPLASTIGSLQGTVLYFPDSTSIEQAQLSGLFNETSNKISQIKIDSGTANGFRTGSFALIEGYKKV